MLNEIDRDFYCTTAGMADCPERGNYQGRHCKGCPDCHRKYPIPEQFKEEYGEEYADNRPVFVLLDHTLKDWDVAVYRNAMHPKGLFVNGHYSKVLSVVCACTPFGKPPQDWRVE